MGGALMLDVEAKDLGLRSKFGHYYHCCCLLLLLLSLLQLQLQLLRWLDGKMERY